MRRIQRQIGLIGLAICVIGCGAKDPSPDPVYPPLAGVNTSYQINLQNGLKKIPVTVQFDDHPPIDLKMWRYVTLPRGPHTMQVRGGDSTLPPVNYAFTLDGPAKLVVRDPQAAQAAKLQPIEWQEIGAGEVILHNQGGGDYFHCSIESNRTLTGRAIVKIDDYPPFQLYSPWITFVDLRTGRHRFEAVMPPTREHPQRHFTRTYNIVGPAKITIYDPICYKDARYEGIICESSITRAPMPP